MADQEEERRGKLKIEQEKRLFNNLTHFLDQENALKQQSSQMAFEKKQAHNRILFLIMVFLLSIGVGASFFWRAKRLSLKNEAQFRLELQELKIQLEQYQKEFEQHRVEPNVDTGFIQRQRTAALNQQLQRTKLLTEQEWRTFKLSFEQIYPDFLQKINTHSAQFTPAEVRLLTLSKLGLKSPEIAEILGISMDGVKKGRQRLKKKLLAHSEELELIDLIS
jgi:DNA-binding CsgD family transcriptional regulator/cbb3-type cytochrome oxidase subunit 3